MTRILCATLCCISFTAHAQDSISVLDDLESLEWTYDTERRPELAGLEPFEFDEDVLRLSEKVAGLLAYPYPATPRHLVLEFKWGERTSSDWENTARRANVGAGAGIIFLRESMSGDLLVPAQVAVVAPKSKAYDPSVPDQRGAHTQANQIESPFGHWNRLEVITRADRIEVKLNGQLVNEAALSKPLTPNVSVSPTFAELFIRRWEIYPTDTFNEVWNPELASTDTGYSTTGESILPRTYPFTPEESQAAWKVDGDYELQLVAAEPLTCDPVDVSWDARGRLFVAEMRDYPLPTERGDYLSRIRLLVDTDGDGIMDEAKTWADNLDHIQGLTPHREGFIATTRTAILYLADTDGDDRADHIEPLYRSNDPKHNQLQVSSPRRGLDNWIYLNNGLDLKEIYPEGTPETALNIAKTNIRIHPSTKAIEPVSGYGQFGATQDDFGRRLFSSNRNPVIMAVMPLPFLNRNPYAGISRGYEDIAPVGEDSRVYPLELSHTTSIAHAGTHTAACGLAVYRGNAVPELSGNLFVCEPTAQLVTRSELSEKGAALKATRIGEKIDFLVSRDEWSRPVNLRNGPDGCLYLCDMYRRFIDHARFFPEEFSQSHYMRAGFDQGRIYRLIPKGKKPPAAEPLPDTSLELVALLEHNNAWQRIHAQRLLVESGDTSVVSELESILDRSSNAAARAHAFGTLIGLDSISEEHYRTALADPVSGVAENALLQAPPDSLSRELKKVVNARKGRASFLALLLLGNDHGNDVTQLFQKVLHQTPEGVDPWIRKAILSGSKDRTGIILAHMLTHPIRITTGTDIDRERISLYREFTAAVAARGDADELATVLHALETVENDELRFAVVHGLAEGLPRSTLKTKTLASFIASPPETCMALTPTLSDIIDAALTTATDPTLPAQIRVAAIELANQQDYTSVLDMVKTLIGPDQPAEVQSAAVQSLGRFSKDRQETASYFFEQWKTLPPPARREAITLLTSNNDSALLLMKQMQAGKISPAIMPPMKQWIYGRSKVPELKQLADELFSAADSDRAKVITDYQAALNPESPNLENGTNALQKGTCFTCHRIGGKGVAVGPDLADVRAKPAIALLTDILDPNRAVEERWIAYTITLKDGTIASGLIEAEDAQSVTLKIPGGVTRIIARSEIKAMESTDRSLMPVGLEAALSKEDLADLIAVLKAH